MRYLILLVVVATGCKQVECGDGTIERNGQCEPADVTTNGAMCGPFTVLQGDRCVPMLDPTVCDPATTQATFDPDTGVYTCIGTGGGGCSAQLACAAPTAANHQTICGQIWDFESNTKFADAGATGAKCPTTPTATGPCSLSISAYDAIAFGTNPATATPLAVGSVYVDDCGRYRLADIDVNGVAGFVGLGFDDASGMGPGGTTVTVGVATPRQSMAATKDLEGFVVPQATTTKWATAGGPPLSGGIYAPIYRQHKLGNGDPLAPQAGVQVMKGATMITANDYYFQAAETTRGMVDPVATVTGMNGTALVTNASLADGNVYTGAGGLGANCQWESHSAASLAGIVFVQVYRKLNIFGQTCND